MTQYRQTGNSALTTMSPRRFLDTDGLHPAIVIQMSHVLLLHEQSGFVVLGLSVWTTNEPRAAPWTTNCNLCVCSGTCSLGKGIVHVSHRKTSVCRNPAYAITPPTRSLACGRRHAPGNHSGCCSKVTTFPHRRPWGARLLFPSISLPLLEKFFYSSSHLSIPPIHKPTSLPEPVHSRCVSL
jgi:hypothetical protein